MRSEHRAPLVASIVVVLACFGVMAHAVRTDALGGFARHTPMAIIAGGMLQPKPQVAHRAAPPAARVAPAPHSAPPVVPAAQKRSSQPVRHSQPVQHSHSTVTAQSQVHHATAATTVAQVQPAVAMSPPVVAVAQTTTQPTTQPTNHPVDADISRPQHGPGRGHGHGHGQGHGQGQHTDPGAQQPVAAVADDTDGPGTWGHSEDWPRDHGHGDHGHGDYGDGDPGYGDHGHGDHGHGDHGHGDHGGHGRDAGHGRS